MTAREIIDGAEYVAPRRGRARVISHSDAGVAFEWTTGPYAGAKLSWDREAFSRRFRAMPRRLGRATEGSR